MSEIKRLQKGASSPEQLGRGDTFIIPADCLPSGLESGKKYKMVIEGDLNIDEQGGVINADRIYAEEVSSREDLAQKSIEDGLKMEININK